MNDNLRIVALIPARSGSKGIIDKNIKLYKGIPLLAHSIKIGYESNYINDVYLSTDSIKYQEVGLKYGAKVVELRPHNISDDLSPDIDTFKHFIQMLKKENIKVPDIIVQLRPTYPNRDISILNDCIKTVLNNYDDYDSLRTVVPIKKIPYKMYHIENNNLIPIMKNYKDFNEPYNQARQIFPDTYLHNGYIDIIKTEIILKTDKLSGINIYPYIMDENETDDIDYLSDFIDSEKK
jgi:CMP-N-acetylneuraminic acid synthetase